MEPGWKPNPHLLSSFTPSQTPPKGTVLSHHTIRTTSEARRKQGTDWFCLEGHGKIEFKSKLET